MRIRKKTIIIIGIAISYLAIFWGVVLAISRATNIQSYISQPHYAINYDEPFPVEKMEFPNAFQDKALNLVFKFAHNKLSIFIRESEI